jgi:ATP-dependent protease HslVU (ClpYQ) peptidase subunit
MTTVVYSRLHGQVGADTQYTTPSGGITRVNKIERLLDGRVFCGSGHGNSIALIRSWAEAGFDPEQRPDFSYYLADPEERGFECFVIDDLAQRVTIVDEELEPYESLDKYVGIGSGSTYALGALYAGASVEQALTIAAELDPSTSAPNTILSLHT